MKKKIFYAILICIIVAGAIVIGTMGLKADIIYSKNVRIDMYLGKEYNHNEVEQIAKEIFNTKIITLENINIQLIELSKKSYTYLECIDIVENTKKRLKMNANYDMCIDNMLLQMKEKLNF